MDNMAIIGSNNVNSFNTTIAADDDRILQWLSPLEPQRRHQQLRDNRLQGLGEWVFGNSEFQRWDAGETGSSCPVLFCHGDPGVGKTHLSSVVIDHFHGRQQDIAVAGLYCDYLDRNEQTTSNMLGAMLKQLVGGGNIPENIRKAFGDGMKHFGGVRPEVPELLKMLKMAITQRSRVVICVDGLDESLGAHRTGLLTVLQTIVHESPNVRLFLTGRPFVHSEVETHFPDVGAISVSPTKEDTETFLRMKLGEDTEPDAMDESLRADIMEIIPRTISEIFLLVSLGIDTILGETTIRRRREKLRQISSGQDVADVYNEALERIKAQKKDRARLGMEAIMWIAYSERPHGPDELCQALGVEIGSTDLDSDNTPSIRTILNCGLGLVMVDSSSSKVRLVHFTLQEHILANPTLFHSPHSMIAEVCLTYLNFSCIKNLSPALPSPPPTAPFLEYASCYWGEHARREASACVISLALKLLDRFNAHISCKLLLSKEFGPGKPLETARKPFNMAGSPMGFTGLHGGALLGVLEIIVPLLKMREWDLNATDLGGNTALVLAAGKGHREIVKVLLEQDGLDPDGADYIGRTPFSWAARNGYAEILRILLEKDDVNPNRTDSYGRTPLAWAALEGHGEIVKMLLERSDVNPDTAAGGNGTPLNWATMARKGEVVKMLLERPDVNPNKAISGGQTPLSWAAMTGNEEIVKLLLERNDVGPDAADDSGRTPLSWAATNESEEIVELLLEQDNVDPDRADNSGRTPLSWAAQCGNESIVWLLLQQSDVNPNTADESGRTPLSFASESGHQEIVDMLSDEGNMGHDTAAEIGQTLFPGAATFGHGETVDMLPERGNVYTSTAGEGGRTPFPLPTRRSSAGVRPRQSESDRLAASRLLEELLRALISENSQAPERPLKRIRRS